VVGIVLVLPALTRQFALEEGGALAMVGGDLSFAGGLHGQRDLHDVLPVKLNDIPADGPGARALLVHPSQKSSDGNPAPVLAVTDVGRRRTLALLTDSA
jgi:hypothetical protein